jgi:hypothetical protein
MAQAPQMYNTHVYYEPELRKLLEENFLHDEFLEKRYRRYCEQIHRRNPKFDPGLLADKLRLDGLEDHLVKISFWMKIAITLVALQLFIIMSERRGAIIAVIYGLILFASIAFSYALNFNSKPLANNRDRPYHVLCCGCADLEHGRFATFGCIG